MSKPPRRACATTRVVVVMSSLALAGIACRRDVSDHVQRSSLVAAQASGAPVPQPPPASGASVPIGRHSRLLGAHTEAICTSLPDLHEFYNAAHDQTQESLSCSLISGGRSTADVVVYESHDSSVRVRLYDGSGHYSDGYMRRQAVR